MARKRHKHEEIVAKLRQVHVLTLRGTPLTDAVCATGVSGVTYFSPSAHVGKIGLIA